MISKRGKALEFYVFFTLDGAGVAALTVTADIYKNGSKIITDAATVDMTGGLYSYTLSGVNNDAEGEYIAIFKCAGDVDNAEIPAIWVVGLAEDTVDLTWDEILADHLNAGSTGEALYNSQVAGGGQLSIITQTSGNIVAGTEFSGTVASTEAEDGVLWEITHTGDIDVQITLDATNLFISELLVTAGLIAHQNDFVNIEAWNTTLNAGSGGWEEVSTPATRVNPGLGLVQSRILLNENHDDSGTVIIRFFGSLRNASTLMIDYNAIIASTSGGYILTAAEVADATAAKMIGATYGGMVYLDTVNGEDPAEMTLGETGTAIFPLATLPEAASLANALGNAVIRVSRSSTIVLAQNYLDMVMANERSGVGNAWSLDLNGQDISSCVITGANVTGIYTEASGYSSFKSCEINVVSGPSILLDSCVLKNKVSAGVGGFVLFNCVASAQLGLAGIAFTEGTALANVLDYNGYLRLSGMAGNEVAVSGTGILVIDSTCTSGILKVEGNWDIVDEAGGVLTIHDDANFQREQVIDDVWDEAKADHQLPGSFGEHVQLNTGSSGAAVNTVATSYLLTAGIQSSGTVDNTKQVNLVYHEHEDDGGALDLYYEFSVGGAGIPTGVTIVGRIMGSNDDLDGVYVYDWSQDSWDQVGAYLGTNGTADNVDIFSLLTNHVGTGANLGLVRIRFYAASGLSSATLYIDQIFVSYAIVASSVGYADGSVWIDTGGSNEGTEPYVDGTADNPVSTLAAATTIANDVGLKIFSLLAGSSIILQQEYISYSFRGYFANVDLNGQNVDGCTFQNMVISGNDDGANSIPMSFINCQMGSETLGIALFEQCRLAGTLTLTQAGDYFFNACYSAVAGTGTPGLDFGAAVGDSNVSFRHYSGGIEIFNMGAVGTDKMSLEGEGQLKIAANCVAGTIALRGHFFVTDNAAGAIALSEIANFDKAVLIPEQTADINALETDDARLDNLDATISSRASQASVDAIPPNPLLDNDVRLDNLDVAISSRSTQASVDAIYAYLQTMELSIAPEDMQTIADLVLTTGVGTVEDDADVLSMVAMILAMFKARVNPVSSKIVIYKSDGVTQFAEQDIAVDVDALPIISVGL